ncbi:MAG: FkbM family methyltransferase [Elusimicrobia bacterium]|nr:FkbM family methyltransferase [Elusimicrobiota bacterium]
MEKIWQALRPLARTLLGPRLFHGAMEFSGLRRLKSRFWLLETRLPDGGRLRYRPHDQCVISEIYEQGIYRGSRPYLAGQTVVDVGAHIGVFTLYAARQVGPSGRVVSVEPDPKNLELLKANIALNDCGNVQVLPAALSSRAGSGKLFVADKSSDNPAANTLHETPGRRAIMVDVRTLDDTLEGVPRIDHLKLDVEGAELAVLEGGERALARTSRVIMELHPSRVAPDRVLDWLTARGFDCQTLCKEPLIAEALRKVPAGQNQ